MRLLLVLSIVPLSSAFMWDLLGSLGLGGGMGGGGGGMGGPGYGQPPPCGGGGGEYAGPPPPQYMAPPPPQYMPPPPQYMPPPPQYVPPPMPAPQQYVPPPPPPSAPYATAGSYKRRHKRAVEEPKGVSNDVECNSDDLRKIMKKAMTEDETETRSRIAAALEENDSKIAVICSSSPLKSTISSSVEACLVKSAKFTCYAIVLQSWLCIE
ncbi:unnamed protein product [Heligmosomoides polygyrus]|uniref:Ground-like domain-containing protein n=1 Tax=Heligmosomoides polygyrus TaxID=6339 RepID=A0A183FN69_HELPZ|nr:unnamed protein product [Heligmosomoides polygyrus]